MAQNRTFHIDVALFGLDNELANSLHGALATLCESSTATALPDADECLKAMGRVGANVIFCRPDPHVIAQIRADNPNTTIIAVSRLAEVSDWLDSIEAGANDYCAAPFEPADLRWILESNLRYSQAAA